MASACPVYQTGTREEHARQAASPWAPRELPAMLRRDKEVLMVRIEVSHTFPVSVAEAFAYITDMKNWPE